MSKRSDKDEFYFVPTPGLLELLEGPCTYVPNSWIEKMARACLAGRQRGRLKYDLWPAAWAILQVCHENGVRTITLPQRRLPLTGIELVYDGLDSRSKWRRALAKLEQRGLISLTWHKQSALITLILTQEEQDGFRSIAQPSSPPVLISETR
jgi:hypothetical protein